MFCPKCGKKNDDDAPFCILCGANFQAGVKEAFVKQKIVSTADFRYAGFWRRFAAAFIDSIVFSVLVMPIDILLQLFGEQFMQPEVTVLSVLGMIFIEYTFSILIWWIYSAGMESSSKQATLGKMALKIKVTDLSGERISFRKATGRYFAKIISALTFGFGFVMVVFTEKKQALHDKIAGTLVLKK